VELLLIRHALPVRRELTDGAGPADPELAPLGRQQAAALAVWLRTEDVDALWSSPMRRARETAAPVADALGLSVVVDEGLSEYDREAHFYIPIEELKAANDPRWYEVPERPEEFVAHVVAAVERIVTAHPSGNVAVVCHGGVINAYLAELYGLHASFFCTIENRSVTVVRVGPHGRVVVAVNDCHHLYDPVVAGPPVG